MKTVKKFILSLHVVCFLSSNAYAWVENYSSSVGFLDKVATAVNFRSPLDTYSRVNSKWNQPRDEGSNPHKGVDLRASVGTPIYAVYDGWVEHINVTGNADIRFRVDVNGNQVKDSPDYYVRFYHCNSRLAEGYYSKGAQIGTSGNQGGVPAHLHYGITSETSVSSFKWARNEINYRWLSSSTWDSGKQLDSYSQVRFPSNVATITTYFCSSGTDIVPTEVLIYHRNANASSKAWSSGAAMTKSGNTYTYDFNGVYPVGTTVEWTVRIKRGSLGNHYPYAFAPAKYSRPSENVNSGSYTFAYYSNTIS